jgi:hypothetical protein
MRRIQVIGMAGLLVMALLLACSQEPTGAQVATQTKAQAKSGVKPYEAQDFSKLKGMAGLKQIAGYAYPLPGYVKIPIAAGYPAGRPDGQPGMRVKRRFGWEFDGMRSMSSTSPTWGARNPWPRTASSGSAWKRILGVTTTGRLTSRPPAPCGASVGLSSMKTPNPGGS